MRPKLETIKQFSRSLSTFSNTKPLGLRTRAVLRQVSMVVLANLCSVPGGMALGLPTVTLAQLKDTRNSYALNESQGSWYASINAIACPLGSLLSSYLLDKIGRKRTVISVNIISILSWIILATSSFHEDNLIFFIQVMISRFLMGISMGLASSPCGVYAAEISHPSLRGRLTLGTSVGIATGVFIIYTIGYFIRDDWRLISILALGYTIIAFMLAFIIVESPSWLLSKRRNEEAKQVLRYFNGIKKSDTNVYNEIENDFATMEKSLSNPNGQKKEKLWIMLKRPEVWKPLLIMIGFFAFQQFSGTFVVIVYAVQLSIDAGVNIDPVLCAIIIGLTRLLTTFLVGFIYDKWGRRPPAILSGFGMSICMILLAACTWYPDLGNIPYFAVGCIIVYILTSTLGLLTLPFSMLSEVYPPKIRGPCAGITTCFGYLMSFIAVNRYMAMVDGIGKENVFAFYGAVSFLSIIFLYLFLPETKGKSLIEIEEYFIYGKDGKLAKKANLERRETITTY
ncbi:facilitated trehalose transporter Tret1-2 homolog [Condylostylus longicornis]|uniref:facilitated trehalose transporter Tret1-2 homolog n=1 Tax=Condylostylus longicornis TaxID=2530218 RepID=UPI00244E01AA|nr:facilitated trehalose transporter Tret1-2 homolog [Condylostylus longicornis]